MKFLYIKRGVRWLWALTFTLIKFWLRNPLTTPAIIFFIIRKSLYLPKFLNRNVLVEKHSQTYAEKIKKVTQIYNRLGDSFTLDNPNSYKKLVPQIADRYALLYFIVRKLKPKVIVETGVAAGISSGYILQALQDNGYGKLYSIDLPFQWYVYGGFNLHLDSLPAGKIPGYLIPEQLKKNWKLILGNTYEELPLLLKKLKGIDIFFHDSEHTYQTMTFEYKTSWPLIKNGGILISDDVPFTKAFKDFTNQQKLKSIFFGDLGIAIKSHQ